MFSESVLLYIPFLFIISLVLSITQALFNLFRYLTEKDAGNGKSSAMEAIAAAKQEGFSVAKEKLKEAGDALNQAHHIQISLIQSEIRGEKNEISLLMIHAQDHLMNAITMKDLATEFVELYECMTLSNAGG